MGRLLPVSTRVDGEYIVRMGAVFTLSTFNAPGNEFNFS